MTSIDLGPCTVADGECPRCKLDDRPLWAPDGLILCATCCARHHADAAITFHAGRGPITARQSTLPGLVA